LPPLFHVCVLGWICEDTSEECIRSISGSSWLTHDESAAGGDGDDQITNGELWQ